MACGLLGRLLFESGYHSIFISRRNDILESINRNHGYKVLVGANESCRVRDATALHLNDLNEINKALSFADIVFTAVGVDNVSRLSPLIAAGLSLRQKINPGSVNIIASENLPGAGAYLRHQILTHVPSDEAIIIGNTVGFSNALTHCIMTGGENPQGELSFQADSVGSLVINSQGLKGGLPQISHTSQTDCFDFAFKRKLYTINLAQAVAAYVGYQHNCQFIHEAALHPEVRPIIIGAVEDACSALQCEMPEERELIAQDAMLAFERISNPVLADHITRVTP